jgi:hypothetical protein
MEAIMDLTSIIGYCPISNPNPQVRSFLDEIGNMADFLGFELIGNVDSLPSGEALAYLAHELLIRYALLSPSEFPNEKLECELIDCLQGYIGLSIAGNHDQIRVLDTGRLSQIVHSNKIVMLNLNMLKKYLDLSYQFTDLSSNSSIEHFRKIEYCAYFLLVSVQIAIFDTFKISNSEHKLFISLPNGQTDKRIVFGRCFDILKFKVEFGQGWFGNSEANYDNWLTNEIIPVEITRAPYPKETLLDGFEITEFIGNLKSLVTDPKEFSRNIQYLATNDDSKEFRKIFAALLIGLFMWKDGLSYFAWLPILGDLCGFLGNSAWGRVLGFFAFAFIIQDVEFKFKMKMIFQQENILGSMILLGIILGSIFTI